MMFYFAFFSESWFFGRSRVQNNYQVHNNHQTPLPMTCINAVNYEELFYNNAQHFITHLILSVCILLRVWDQVMGVSLSVYTTLLSYYM
jgi:hypothetical protein